MIFYIELLYNLIFHLSQGEYIPRAEIIMAANSLDHRVLDERITDRLQATPFAVSTIMPFYVFVYICFNIANVSNSLQTMRDTRSQRAQQDAASMV